MLANNQNAMSSYIPFSVIFSLSFLYNLRYKLGRCNDHIWCSYNFSHWCSFWKL